MPNQNSEVFAAAELEQDRFSRARCANFIGSIALKQETALEPINAASEYTNLLEAAQRANEGNTEARASVETNVRTAATEAIYKASHIIRTKTAFKEDGSLIQHGHAMIDIYGNTLRYRVSSAPMRRRIEAETLNGHRIEDLKRSGWLSDYWVVALSLYPDDITQKEATNEGFFGPTKTGVFQATTVENEQCIIESAFVAGVTSEDSKRHDLEAGRALYKRFGVITELIGATDFLENPLLIPKSLMPNGVIDIVKLFDEEVGDVFFGQKKSTKDYDKFALECDEREARLSSAIQEVTQNLIETSTELKTPIAAVQHLHNLVRHRVVQQAGQDSTIDANVFGPQAAYFIKKARYLDSIGETDKAREAVDKAELYAEVTMCGAGSCGLEKVNSQSADTKVAKELLGADSEDDMVHDTERACPSCRQKRVYYKVTTGDKACAGCKTRQINGKVEKPKVLKKVA